MSLTADTQRRLPIVAWRRDRLAGRGIAIAVLALLLSSLATIWIAPLFDPDEGYYPATAAESVDAGRAWDPRFNGEPRWDKPILTYALIELSFGMFGRNAGAARLPSVAIGVLLVIIVGLFVHRAAGPRAGGAAALILATTLGVQAFARAAHPELGVVFTITTAELIAVAWLTTTDAGARLRLAVAGGLVTGLGVLFKGPVAIALPALAVGTASLYVYGVRRPSGTAVRHLLIAGGVTGAVALPWFALMTAQHGTAFLHEAIWQHNVGRFTGASFVHRTRLLFFVVPALLAMFPWTFLVPLGLSSHARTGTPQHLLWSVMVAAATTSFLFYSLSHSKLAHYALAFVPPLAILAGLSARAWKGRLARLAFDATGVALGVLAVGFAAGPWLIDRTIGARQIINTLPSAGHDTRWLFELPCRSVATVLALAAIAVWVSRGRRAAPVLAATGIAVPLVLMLSAQPLLAYAYPWRRIGPHVQDPRLPVWQIGARAPSLDFYAGRPIQRASETEALQQPLPDVETWVVVRQEWASGNLPRVVGDPRWEPVESFNGVLLARWHGSRAFTNEPPPVPLFDAGTRRPAGRDTGSRTSTASSHR